MTFQTPCYLLRQIEYIDQKTNTSNLSTASAGVSNHTKAIIANTLLRTVLYDFLKTKKMDLSLFRILAA